MKALWAALIAQQKQDPLLPWNGRTKKTLSIPATVTAYRYWNKKRQRGKVVRGWFCSASLNAITPERLELHFLLEPLTEKTSVADRLVCVSCWMLLVQHILLLFCTPVMTNNACYWTKISLQLSEQSCLAEIRLNDFCKKKKMFFLRIRSQLLC